MCALANTFVQNHGEPVLAEAEQRVVCYVQPETGQRPTELSDPGAARPHAAQWNTHTPAPRVTGNQGAGFRIGVVEIGGVYTNRKDPP